MMNKNKAILLFILLFLTIGIIASNYVNQLGALFAEGVAPNPGHSWDQMECSSELCVNGGNVGIGTATPGVKLDVGGVIRGKGFIPNQAGDTRPDCSASTEGMQWYDYDAKHFFSL
jgi:hypothetical protein